MNDELKDKTLVLRCPDMPHDGEPEGRMTLVASILNEPDTAGDILLRGAVGEQSVIFGPWQHSLIKFGAAPLGRARVYESGDRLLADVQLDMRRQEARDLWQSIDFNRDLVEFSVGMRPREVKPIMRGGELYRGITKARVFEMSPTPIGASTGTGVLDMKSAVDANEVDDAEELPDAALLDAVAAMDELLRGAEWHPW